VTDIFTSIAAAARSCSSSGDARCSLRQAVGRIRLCAHAGRQSRRGWTHARVQCLTDWVLLVHTLRFVLIVDLHLNRRRRALCSVLRAQQRRASTCTGQPLRIPGPADRSADLRPHRKAACASRAHGRIGTARLRTGAVCRRGHRPAHLANATGAGRVLLFRFIAAFRPIRAIERSICAGQSLPTVLSRNARWTPCGKAWGASRCAYGRNGDDRSSRRRRTRSSTGHDGPIAPLAVASRAR
jgi:hypothetical protein